MTEEEFKKLQVPVFPYSDFGMHENPTAIGYFIKNASTECQLNVWFCKYREETSITLFNPHETEMNTHKEVFRTKSKKQLSQSLFQLIDKYLK